MSAWQPSFDPDDPHAAYALGRRTGREEGRYYAFRYGIAVGGITGLVLSQIIDLAVGVLT